MVGKIAGRHHVTVHRHLALTGRGLVAWDGKPPALHVPSQRHHRRRGHRDHPGKILQSLFDLPINLGCLLRLETSGP